MAAVDLARAVEAADYAEVLTLLDSISEDRVQEYARWWESHGRTAALASAKRDHGWLAKDSRPGAGAICRLLAVRLEPQAENVARLLVRCRLSSDVFPHTMARLLESLAARGRAWCADFVEALAAVPLSRERSAFRDERVIVDLLEPLVAYFGLPLPAGAHYPLGWIERVAHVIQRAALDAPDAAVRLLDRVTLACDGSAHVDERPLAELGLVDVLATTPRLADIVDEVLTAPGILGFVRRSTVSIAVEAQWQFVPAVVELVRRGQLDRERLLARCFHALQIRDDASTQGALADLLSGLGMTPSDLAGQSSEVLRLMRTARGPVTAVLLPVLLTGPLPTGSLVELTSTVLDRPEKAQQQLLIRALVAKIAADRFGEDDLIAALRLAAAVSDLRIAERAWSALERLSGSADAMSVESSAAAVAHHLNLWTAHPAPVQAQPVPDIDATVASLADLADLSEAEGIRNWAPRRTSLSPVTEARLLATLTAAFHDSPGEVLDWIRARRSYLGNGSVLDVVHHWAEGFHRADAGSATNPWEHFRRRLENETIERLGTVRELLSTPSLDDGTVKFDDLIGRIARARGIGYGPMDLLQALLRLEPVHPSRASELTGMTMRVAPALQRCEGDASSRSHDGARIAATWIREGGIRHDVHGGATGRLVLPGSAHFLPFVQDDMLLPPRGRVLSAWSTDAKEFLVLPGFGDLFAAGVEALLVESKEAGRLLPLIVRLGVPGPATHALVVRALTHPDAATRMMGAEAVLTVIARGHFDPDCFTAALMRLLEARELSLRRTAGALEHVLVFGGMAPIWPVVVRLLDVVCAAPAPISGAADLVALVRRYADEAPIFTPSPTVRGLASLPGTTKLAREARALASAGGIARA